MGQTPPTPVANTLEAERFVLRDHAGNVARDLGLRPDGTAALALADDTQQDRAVLSVTALGQAGVDLSDRAGHLRAGLGVRADGAALLTLPRPDGSATRRAQGVRRRPPEPRPARPGRRPRSLLALTAEGATGLTLYDRNGRRRSAMGTSRRRARGVALRRRGQRPRDARRHR